MSEKKWADQPDEVQTADVIGSFRVDRSDMSLIVELRVAQRQPQAITYYVTAGTIFGSQTIKCDSADAVLKVLVALGKRSTSARLIEVSQLTAGATLMEAAA